MGQGNHLSFVHILCIKSTNSFLCVAATVIVKKHKLILCVKNSSEAINTVFSMEDHVITRPLSIPPPKFKQTNEGWHGKWCLFFTAMNTIASNFVKIVLLNLSLVYSCHLLIRNFHSPSKFSGLECRHHYSHAIICWQYWSFSGGTNPLHSNKGELAEHWFILAKDYDWPWIWRHLMLTFPPNSTQGSSAYFWRQLWSLTWNLSIILIWFWICELEHTG